MMAAEVAESTPHKPVLIGAILEHVGDVTGRWLDGTFGAGGYARALLEAGADSVIGVDRDPAVFEMARSWADQYAGRLTLVEGNFSDLDRLADGPLDGIVLDLGVSSMQLDQAERGFSFLRNGPLDMRMAQKGPSAADLVNAASEARLADILFQFGEERASRRLARAIVDARPVKTTAQLAALIEAALPKVRKGESHPATRSFQALRIAVNDEFGQLISGLEAAERALRPGGWLAVVTFHSLEDRVVKKFLAAHAGRSAGGSRYAPQPDARAPSFTLSPGRAIAPSCDEIETNRRARSAKLRLARRTEAPVMALGRARLGLPALVGQEIM